MTQFIVGPVELYPSTKSVLQNGYTYFRTETFGKMVKDNLSELSELLGNHATNSLIYLTASGTGAMEAVVENCVGKDDKVLVINGGGFGKRFAELLSWHNITNKTLDLQWNETLTASHFRNFENQGFTALFVNIDETTSGQLYDIRLISDFCKRNNMFLVVDAISSFLADEYDMEKYGIDATIISSQKGLCLSPGLSFVSLSKRMIDKVMSQPNPSTFYFDFKQYFKDIDRGQTPFTPAVFIMYELADMLNMIRSCGGKEAWRKKVADKASYFRKKAKEYGLVIPDYPKSNTLTPVYFENISARDVVDYLGKNFELYVNPCGGDLASKLLRVAHIGCTDEKDIDNLLEKMAIAIEKLQKQKG